MSRAYSKPRRARRARGPRPRPPRRRRRWRCAAAARGEGRAQGRQRSTPPTAAAAPAPSPPRSPPAGAARPRAGRPRGRSRTGPTTAGRASPGLQRQRLERGVSEGFAPVDHPNRSDSAYRSSTTSPSCRVPASTARRAAVQGNAAGPTTRGARASPTKNGAITSCSSSARASAMNCVSSLPPPSTMRRCTPRPTRSSSTSPIVTRSPSPTTVAALPRRVPRRCARERGLYTIRSTSARGEEGGIR